ncbi:hypothetical protein B566_EDAN019309, partial [Ephemera danica]
MAVISLIKAFRSRGHLLADTNPVRTRKDRRPRLELKDYALTEADLDLEFEAGKFLGIGNAKLSKIIETLNKIYAGHIGFEYSYIREPDVKEWLRNKIEKEAVSFNLPIDEKKRILEKLNEAVVFENFLHTKFLGQKRFSLEGGETTIPALDAIINQAADLGTQEVMIGMAHRGRLNILANIMGKSYEAIFDGFEGNVPDEVHGDGDVKYHLGYSSKHISPSGKEISLKLAPNPSHLEAVNPVVEGFCRARADVHYEGDYDKILPIIIHGDAAVAGQGIVYEVTQMAKLKGYETGGTLHFVINNQVGFTTDFEDARSSIYCTDVAKIIDAPVFHVNGDDPEAVVFVSKMAIEFRAAFNRDVFIDMVCYRRYGHNESDEPKFTQPTLYNIIATHQNPRELYNQQLVAKGEVDAQLAIDMDAEFKAELQARLDEIFNSLLSEYGVLGFEFGYALANPDALVVWEAQFGDFANGAQTMIDQFISSNESKWQTMNGMVLLLPHGYEGQGPEHSNARPERYLQLAAEDNMVICNITTPANIFHVLRRQLAWEFRKPLVVMSPKSTFRHPKVVSLIEEFTKGAFQEIYGDSFVEAKKVKKVLLCSEMKVPPVGESITEVTLASWKKKTGDTVVRDEIICELESDKATFELPAEADGIITIVAKEGDVLPIGGVICTLQSPGNESVKIADNSSKEVIAEAVSPTFPASADNLKSVPAKSIFEIKVPAVGESITEVTIATWSKSEGETVKMDEVLCELESDKATFELPAEVSGVLHIVAKIGAVIPIGGIIATIATNGQNTIDKPTINSASEATNTVKIADSSASHVTPIAAKILEEKGIDPKNIAGTGEGGKITKEDALLAKKAETAGPAPATVISTPAAVENVGDRGQRRERMSSLRKTVARRLVAVKNETAMLTTFNEVDMKPIMDLRTLYKEKFKEKHGVGLGFMSFFTKAVCVALKEFPSINAKIDGDEIVFSDYCDVSIAVSAPKGLVVPVIRNAETLSLAGIEKEVVRLATKAKENKLTLEEMNGGTFTITNGGIFGSMLSTPIINAPQVAILGMHNIVERPVAIAGQVVIRPIMYLALSYDHRIVDGKES